MRRSTWFEGVRCGPNAEYFSQGSHIGTATRYNRADLQAVNYVIIVIESWSCGAMMERDPEREEEKPLALRSAAVEVLRSAIRQKDPNEFDRLTRYALALIERARGIRQEKHRAVSYGDTPLSQHEPRRQQKEGFGPLGKSTPELFNKLWRLCSWTLGR